MPITDPIERAIVDAHFSGRFNVSEIARTFHVTPAKIYKLAIEAGRIEPFPPPLYKPQPVSLRIQAIVDAYRSGLLMAEVAEKFNTHPQSVQRTISAYERKTGDQVRKHRGRRLFLEAQDDTFGEDVIYSQL